MEYKCSPPKLISGVIQVKVDPSEWIECYNDFKRFEKADACLISIRKYYKKRTYSQLKLVWDIAHQICKDPESTAYGSDPSNVYEGIKFRAVSFGYPLIETRLGKRTIKVPKSASNDSDLTTAEMNILIETAFLVASECGADVRKYFRDLNNNKKK